MTCRICNLTITRTHLLGRVYDDWVGLEKENERHVVNHVEYPLIQKKIKSSQRANKTTQ